MSSPLSSSLLDTPTHAYPLPPLTRPSPSPLLTMAFVSASVGTPLRAGRSVAASRTRPAGTSAATRMQTRPGLPPGEDARENAPLRYYVPVPVETYEKRSFATVLPKTWEGEVVTIGAPDVPEMTKESIAESKLVPVSAASTAAFLEYSNSVKAEREAALAAYVFIVFFSSGEGSGGAGRNAVVVPVCTKGQKGHHVEECADRQWVSIAGPEAQCFRLSRRCLSPGRGVTHIRRHEMRRLLSDVRHRLGPQLLGAR